MNEVIGYVDVRSAEVATTAIAADVAQVHQDMLDADADAQAAAASAAAAAGTLANAVKKTGEASQSIAGDIAVAGDLTGGTVTVPTPVNNTDAASKKYVDDQDALKISITDVNSYAVGLTGNQGPIAGMKEFEYTINNNLVTRDTSTGGGSTSWRRLFTCSSSSSASNRNVTIILVGTRLPRMDILTLNYGGLIGTGSSTMMFGIFDVRICRNNNGNIEIWSNAAVYGYCIMDGIRTVGKTTNCRADLSATDSAEPVVGADFSAVATPTTVIQ